MSSFPTYVFVFCLGAVIGIVASYDLIWQRGYLQGWRDAANRDKEFGE